MVKRLVKIKRHFTKGIIKLCLLCSRVQYQDGQKRRKPNYSSVDLSEVEWEDKDDIVRVKPLKASVIERNLALQCKNIVCNMKRQMCFAVLCT